MVPKTMFPRLNDVRLFSLGDRWLKAVDRRWIDGVVYLVWLAALGYMIFGFWGLSYDDVFLAFRYAKNLEAGNGFVFNPGENFLGTPAPLFVMLLVIVHKLLPFITIPQAGSLISGLGVALAGMAIYQIGRYYEQRLVGALAALLVMFNPLTILVLGGETPLYLAFITIAIYCYVTERYAGAAVLLGLALMNRTEALVPIGLLFGLYTLEKRRLPLRMGLISAAVVVPWISFACWKFGSPLTNSFTAKVSQVMAGAERYPFGLIRWLQEVILRQHPLFWAAIPLIVLGVVALAFTSKPWRIIVAWTALQTAAYACLPIPFYHWYAAQVGVLAAVLVALGAIEAPRFLWRTARMLQERADAGSEQVPGSARRLSRQWGMVCNAVVLCVLLTLPFTTYVHLTTTRGYQKAWPHGPANMIYQRVGEWFAVNTAPNARIAYLEIGQIAFYSDRYIIDTLGLVTPEVADHVSRSDWLWPLLRYKPDYIIYNPIFKDWTDSDAIFKQAWFKDGFREVAKIELPPYPGPLYIYQRQPGAAIPDP